MLTRKTVLLAKTETEYGVDAGPTAAENALLVRNLEVQYIGEALARDVLRPSLSPLEFSRGARCAQVSFETEVKGTGAAGALPSWGWEGELFKACAMEEVVDDGASITYRPSSILFPSVTLHVYVESLFRKIVGCRGTWTLRCESGKYGFFEWEFKGLYVAPQDLGPGTPVFSTVKPPVCLGSQLTVGGYAPAANKIEVSLNNKIAQRRSINSATGVLEQVVTGREPGGSFDPEATLEATYDFWAKWESATPFPLRIGTIGSAPGNRMTVSAPAMQQKEVKDGERDGVFVYDAAFGLAGSAGDDEVTVVFE